MVKVTALLSVSTFVISSFCSNYILILVLRFITGASSSPFFDSGYILCKIKFISFIIIE